MSAQHFGPDWNILTTTGSIAIKLCTDIHVTQRMNPNDDFGDALTFLHDGDNSKRYTYGQVLPHRAASLAVDS